MSNRKIVLGLLGVLGFAVLEGTAGADPSAPPCGQPVQAIPVVQAVQPMCCPQACGPSAAPAAPAPPTQLDVSGTYHGTWGTTTLRQVGARVTGSYAYHDGQIDGRLDGNVLRFTWREDDGVGGGVFTVGPGGDLTGTWGSGSSDHDGGGWRLWRGDGDVAGAVTAATPEAPHASTLLGLRLPWDFTFLRSATGSGLGVGMVGIGLDLGRQGTDGWYTGVSADWEKLLTVTSGSGDPRSLNRFRAGLEARYRIHEATGGMSVNDGPYTPVPLHYWVGGRVGAETLDRGKSLGGFGELSLGMDWQIGGTQLGMYLSGGVSIEPTKALAALSPKPSTDKTTVSASPSGSEFSPYLGFGMRVSL